MRPWPLGPASAMPTSSAAATSSRSSRWPSAPASPSPALATNAARTPLGAQEGGVRGGRRAHEDEVGTARRHVADLAVHRPSENLPAVAVHGEDLPAVAEAKEVVQRDEAELARVAGGAGDDHAARVEERTQALE